MQTRSISLADDAGPGPGAGAALLAAGLFTVLLAENCRVPFDDPNTHLELTMIHEVMMLDHSGPPLAVILHGASLKLLLFAVLLTDAVLPMGALAPVSRLLLLAGCWRWRWRRPGGVAAGAARLPARPAAAPDGRPALRLRPAASWQGGLA